MSTEAIRLAQVIYALSIGGSEMLAWRLASALNRTGQFACSISGIDHGGPLAALLAADGIPCYAYSRHSKLDLHLISRLARQFRQDNVRLVHTHHLGQLIYGGLAGRLVGARIIHTEHEFYTLSRRRHQRLLRLLAGLTHTVTSVAEPVTEFLRAQVRIPPEKLMTITNGVNVSRFQSAEPLDRKALGWEHKDVVIGCVARLGPEKGHAVLLQAFSLVHRRMPFARLLLVGDGSERERLMATVGSLNLQESVCFLGLRDDIPEVLAMCDIVALASYNEGLSMAILEAMAAAKPVVATRVGGMEQLVRDGETGLLVPPGDAEAFAEALSRLITDSEQRRRFATEALTSVQTYYDFDQSVEQYKAVYQSALKGRLK